MLHSLPLSCSKALDTSEVFSHRSLSVPQKVLHKILKYGPISRTLDLEKDTASVTYNPEPVSTDDFKEVVKEAGYDFVISDTMLFQTAMTLTLNNSRA